MENFIFCTVTSLRGWEKTIQDSIFKLCIKFFSMQRKKHFLDFISWKSFKNNKKYFLFYLENSFRFQDIQSFVLTF